MIFEKLQQGQEYRLVNETTNGDVVILDPGDTQLGKENLQDTIKV